MGEKFYRGMPFVVDQIRHFHGQSITKYKKTCLATMRAARRRENLVREGMNQRRASLCITASGDVTFTQWYEIDLGNLREALPLHAGQSSGSIRKESGLFYSVSRKFGKALSAQCV
jgi:hypothetical protein